MNPVSPVQVKLYQLEKPAVRQARFGNEEQPEQPQEDSEESSAATTAAKFAAGVGALGLALWGAKRIFFNKAAEKIVPAVKETVETVAKEVAPKVEEVVTDLKETINKAGNEIKKKVQKPKTSKAGPK